MRLNGNGEIIDFRFIDACLEEILREQQSLVNVERSISAEIDLK